MIYIIYLYGNVTAKPITAYNEHMLRKTFQKNDFSVSATVKCAVPG